MSKIWIDSEEIEKLLTDVQILTYTDVMGKRTNEIFETLDKAFNLIDYAKKSTNFCVVEWHSVADKPSEEKPILVKYKDNNKTYYLYDHFEINSFFKSDTAKEWAYLPE